MSQFQLKIDEIECDGLKWLELKECWDMIIEIMMTKLIAIDDWKGCD